MARTRRTKRWLWRSLGSLVATAVCIIGSAAGARAQQQRPTHRAKPPARHPPPTRADTVLRDTTGLVHITPDSAALHTLAMDTLRRAAIRDSVRAVFHRDSARTATACAGRRISQITVRPQPPYLPAPADNPHLTAAARKITSLHTTTSPGVIRRYLAFRVGDLCEPIRLTESERLLRAQPFIETANISAFPDGEQSVRIDVFTVDELAGEIGLGVESAAPMVNMVQLGNGNLLGSATRVSLGWAYAHGYPARWSGEIASYQFLGHPWIADVVGIRDHVGGGINASISHPYFTNLQRVGWRVAGGSDHQYIGFRTPSAAFPTLDLERTYTNISGLFRIGSPARFEPNGTNVPPTRYSELALVGAGLSHENDGIGTDPIVLTHDGPVTDTSRAIVEPLANRYPAHNVRRINGLFGYRNVYFLTVRGFDNLLGIEDIPIGIQASGLVGRSIPWFGGSASDPDIFVSGRLDAGAAFRNSVLRFSTQQEARRDVRNGDWDGLIASAHVAWYYKPQLVRTFILSADAAYGQRVRVPFQLALGDVSGGVRGYASSTVAGGRRAVVRAEYRQLISLPWAVVNSTAGFGIAAFIDGGRTWAGDVPFGVTSPFVTSAGVGVLFSVPRESRQLWRVDLAVPLIAQRRAGVEVRISSSGSGAVSWTESPDVSRSRERTISPALFTYP